jgi:sulfite reductase alpha subunit-like flavoprotein
MSGSQSSGSPGSPGPPGPPGRSALVVYGSETGNAQDVAEEVGALAERLHFTTQISELNHVKPVCSLSLMAL